MKKIILLIMFPVIVFGFGNLIEKQFDTITPPSGTLTLKNSVAIDSGTASTLPFLDGSKIITSSVATLDAAGVMAGLTSLDVDNIKIDGNTISSTDTDGNINITPDGAGEVHNSGSLVLTETSGTNELVIEEFTDIVADDVYQIGTRVKTGASDSFPLVIGSGSVSTGTSGKFFASSGFALGNGSTGPADFSSGYIVWPGTGTTGNAFFGSGGSLGGGTGRTGRTKLTSGAGSGETGDTVITTGNAGTTSGDITMATGTGSTRGDFSLSSNDITLTPDGNIILTGFTASQPLKLDGSSNIISGDIDLTTDVTGILPIANGGSGSASQVWVDLTTTQTIDGLKTFDKELTLLELASTPSTPATGDKKIYCLTDDKCYQLNDAGTETELGSGGGGSVDLSAVTQDILPAVTITNGLGSSSKQWNNVFADTVTIATGAVIIDANVSQGVIATNLQLGLQGLSGVDIQTNSGDFTVEGDSVFNGLISQTGLGESTIFGEGAGAADDASTNKNVYIGNGAAPVATTAQQSVIIGHTAGSTLSTASNMVAIGFEAAQNVTAGTGVVAVGYEAVRDNGSAQYNIGIGSNALTAGNSSSARNIGIGVEAGYFARGNGNINIGYQSGGSGSGSITGSQNITIGYQVDQVSNSGSFQINIGDLIYGEMDNGFVGINNTSPAVALDVAGAMTISGAATMQGELLAETTIIMTEIATPPTPAAGTNGLYFKSDDNLYKVNSAGTEVQVDGAVSSDNVKTPSATAPIMTSALFNCNAASGHSREKGNWVTSITNRSGTNCTVTMTQFTNTPNCVISKRSGTATALSLSAASNTSLTITNSASGDFNAPVICHGD